MKKNILRVLSLVLVAAMLFAFASCTQKIEIRFVDKEGNDLALGGAVVTNGSTSDTSADSTPATDVVATEAPATDAPATDATAADTPATEAPATAAPATDAAATEASATEKTATPVSSVPSTKQEICDFYKKAVDSVKAGNAGYVKKEWQAITNLNITGNSTVDGKLGDVVAGYMTTEDAAEDQVSAKGSDDAKDRFPGWYVTDMNDVKSAKCTKNANGNYDIEITMVQEDTPKKEGSRIAKFTNSFLAWEVVDAELQNISLINSYENIHLIYDLTITAEITPEGKFVSMKHTTPCDIKIGAAKLAMVVSIKDKSGHLDNYCTYTNFQY